MSSMTLMNLESSTMSRASPPVAMILGPRLEAEEEAVVGVVAAAAETSIWAVSAGETPIPSMSI